jgi:hypothetical protein
MQSRLRVYRETALYSGNKERLGNNTHQIDTLHNHFHFIKTQSLDMFRASLAHPQEALHEHSFGGCSVLLYE